MFRFRSLMLTFLITIPASSLHARIIRPTTLAGWYDIFLDDKKHLSPFLGYIALESDYIKNMYEYGYIEADQKTLPTGEIVVTRVKGGDPVIVLVYALFHKVGNNFAATSDSRYPAKYLTARDVGKIIATIERIKPGTTITKEASDKLLNSFIRIIEEALILGHENDPAWKRYEDLYFQHTALFQGLQAAAYDKDVITSSQKFHHAQPPFLSYLGHNITFLDWVNLLRNAKTGTLTNIITSLPAQHRANLEQMRTLIQGMPADFFNYGSATHDLLEKSTVLAQTIIDSLKECGYIVVKGENTEVTFPLHTVHTLFLAFLNAISEKTDNFFNYLQELNTEQKYEQLKQNYNQTLATKKLEPTITATNLNREFNKLEEHNTQTFIDNKFEQIAFSYLREQATYLPPFTYVTIKGTSFGACAENDVFNWTLLLMKTIGLFHEATGLYEIDSKKIQSHIQSTYGIELKASPLLEEFLAILRDHDNRGDSSSAERLQKTSVLISNQLGVKYRRAHTGTNALRAELASPYMRTQPRLPQPEKFASVVDDSHYLFELAGFPSSFFKIPSLIFGFPFNTMKDLLTGLKLPFQDQELSSFTDTHAVDSLKTRGNLPTLQTTLNPQNSPFPVKIIASPGHSQILPFNIPSTNRGPDPSALLSLVYFCFEKSSVPSCFSLLPVFARKDIFTLNIQEDNLSKSTATHVVFSSYLEDSKHILEAVDLFRNNQQNHAASYLLKKSCKKNLSVNDALNFVSQSPCNDQEVTEIFSYFAAQYQKFDAEKKLDIFKQHFNNSKSSQMQHPEKIKQLFLPVKPLIKNYVEYASQFPDPISQLSRMSNLIIKTGDAFFTREEQSQLLRNFLISAIRGHGALQTYLILVQDLMYNKPNKAMYDKTISQLQAAIDELPDAALLVEPIKLFTNLVDAFLKKKPTILLNSGINAAEAIRRLQFPLKYSDLISNLNNIFTNLQETLPENK